MTTLAGAPPWSGGCQCGAVRYALAAPPVALWVCHCLECRKQSASAFGISVTVRKSDVDLQHGSVAIWSRPKASGGELLCAFCPACGSRLWHEPVPDQGTLNLKGGALDTAIDLSEAVHIWTARKLPGVVVPSGARTHEREP